MNLGDITTKCFILALIIRDDGERLLLGDGYYEFKNNLQHFQPNTYQNDVVELQGTDGQLLAGQVRRTATQNFNGYIGDATVNRQTIEQKRRDFMTFFRKKHFYKVVYIFPDGSAIQRKRGYIVNAPSAPEMWQRYPEYSIGLNFEDVNYYEYAEDEQGDEIYAHIVALALGGSAEGGLVWDAIGAVSNGITWSQIQTAQGEYIGITNALDIPAKLAGVEMLGKAEQTGTPTPDAPQPISVVTGEQTVRITGKNLLYIPDGSTTSQGITSTVSNGVISCSGTSSTTWAFITTDFVPFVLPAGTYTLSIGEALSVAGIQIACRNAEGTMRMFVIQRGSRTGTFTTTEEYVDWRLAFTGMTAGTAINLTISDIQLELGNSASQYEPYQAQEHEVNLGKNLWTFASSYTNTTSSTQWVLGDSDVSIPAGTYTLSCQTTATGSTNRINFKYADGVSHNTYFNDSVVYTFTEEVKKIALALGASTSVSELQLEEGTQTSYAPYFTPIELAKVGNYQDRIYKDSGKWYIEKQVGKVVLDGTEAGWSWADTARYTITTANIGAREAISDHFTYVNYTGHATTASPSFDISSNLASIGFHDKDITSLNNFKTWLASNPTTVYYALATPTTTEITEQSLIDQLNALGASSLYVGINHIGTDTLNSTPSLKIEYYTDYDIEGAGYEWEPGGNTARTIVTVSGVDSAWPVWTIQGEAQNPTLTNITTGQTITWNGFVPSGQTLTIDMNEMTADLAGANVFEFITGEWIQLQPGNNTLVYTAIGATEDSTLSWNGVAA